MVWLFGVFLIALAGVAGIVIARHYKKDEWVIEEIDKER